ncbi:MAG: DNA cytosine methyltransferase [Novosphingobium sp.]
MIDAMDRTYKTIDLFAGPGGLAEGFSSVRSKAGARVFPIALSVEKEASAFSTLRLRSFVRQFDKVPKQYHDYISGRISKQEMIDACPAEWRKAEHETAMLELGRPEADLALATRLSELAADGTQDTVVIGGPPCQAYSLVGRARNRGIEGYDPAEDHRHFLYREYIGILRNLRPAAFVMENVKGMASAKVDGANIVDLILADLRAAGGVTDSYTLIPIVADARGVLPGFLIRSENFGIPQCRHRVILLGIRKDIADRLPISMIEDAVLQPTEVSTTVADVLEGMPRLRSGLSRGHDSEAAWRVSVAQALRKAAAACRKDGSWLLSVAKRLSIAISEMEAAAATLPRTGTRPTSPKNNLLADWISDAELDFLPNHESRGHMASDLARYAFAAAFAEVHKRSPKASEFPRDLAPEHQNWDSGKFADRFRVQIWDRPSTTVTSHISKDGHYFIHPDLTQCRSLTVREAARLQTFPDNYFFEGNRTQQFVQVGNAVPPLLARQIALIVARLLGVDVDRSRIR